MCASMGCCTTTGAAEGGGEDAVMEPVGEAVLPPPALSVDPVRCASLRSTLPKRAIAVADSGDLAPDEERRGGTGGGGSLAAGPSEKSRGNNAACTNESVGESNGSGELTTSPVGTRKNVTFESAVAGGASSSSPR